MEILKKLESFLQNRSKREILLLNTLLFLLGFALIFTLSFEQAKDKIMQKRTQNTQLEQEFFALENALLAARNIDVKSANALQDEIALLEQNIALQEQQKQLLEKKFGVYFLKDLANTNALHHAEISQSKSVIKVFTQGKYGNVLSFLDSIQTQPQLHIQTLQLYPNSTTQDLVLYVRAHLGAP